MKVKGSVLKLHPYTFNFPPDFLLAPSEAILQHLVLIHLWLLTAPYSHLQFSESIRPPLVCMECTQDSGEEQAAREPCACSGAQRQMLSKHPLDQHQAGYSHLALHSSRREAMQPCR